MLSEYRNDMPFVKTLCKELDESNKGFFIGAINFNLIFVKSYHERFKQRTHSWHKASFGSSCDPRAGTNQ